MKLYLAGPDVFLPDATAIGKIKQRLCAKYGFVGLFPLDNEARPAPGLLLAQAIFRGNIRMMHDADAIVANLTPFRGASADVGTAFEIGYGFSSGKKVFGYTNLRAGYLDRIQQLTSGSLNLGPDGRKYAADGFAVEDFGLFDNLMIVEALLEHGSEVVVPSKDATDPARDMTTFEECLRRISAPAMAPARSRRTSSAT
jgi:nucleoside 2-deoxyribosyltransferase